MTKTVIIPDIGDRLLVDVLGDYIKENREYTELRLPQGVYSIEDYTCCKQFLYIANNDSGLKSVACNIENCDGFTIDGQGSTLLIQGKAIPFIIKNSRNITLKNFIIDWDMDYHGELIVEQQNDHVTVFRVINNCHISFENGRVFFDDYPATNDQHRYHLHLLEYDLEKPIPASKADDFYLQNPGTATQLSEHTFSVEGLPDDVFQVGKLFIASNHVRPNPGIVITDSHQVTLENISIHYALGMATIAQLSSDIELRKVTVSPRANRRVSALADASHFVMCTGHAGIYDCHFSGQLDDATNVHGIYGTVHRVLDDYKVVVNLHHYQQMGIQFGRDDDTIRFLRFPEHLTLGKASIKCIKYLNERFQLIELKHPVPSVLEVGDIIENMTLQPDLTINGCTFVDNRARGILISTSGKVQVTNTHFNSAGSAIRISGDVIDWFEAGATHFIEIINNTFAESNYGSAKWGHATIDVLPAFEMPGNCHYHEKIVIRENIFATEHDCLLYAKNVGYIEFVNNLIHQHDATESKAVTDYLSVNDTAKFTVEGNTFTRK